MRKQNKRVLKKNNKKTEKLKFILLLLIVVIIVYMMYAIINLVIKPVDIVLVEEGIIYSEETAVGYVLRDEEVVSRSKL